MRGASECGSGQIYQTFHVWGAVLYQKIVCVSVSVIYYKELTRTEIQRIARGGRDQELVRRKDGKMNLKMVGEKRVRGGRKMNRGEAEGEALIIPLECPRWAVSNSSCIKLSLSQPFFFFF